MTSAEKFTEHFRSTSSHSQRAVVRALWYGGESARSLIVFTIVCMAIAGAALWALFVARQVLLLMYMSALLAIGFSPLVRAIERQNLLAGSYLRVPRWLAILVVYVPIVGGLAALTVVILPVVANQSRQMLVQLPEVFHDWQAYLIRRHILRNSVTVEDLVHQAPANSDTVGTVLATAANVFGGLLGVVTILMLTFYLLVESTTLVEAFVQLFPKSRQLEIRSAFSEITTKVSAWLVGQLILASVIGLTSVVWLALLGVPYYSVLALIAAIGELIPYIGPLLAAVPGIGLAAMSSWQLALVVAAFYLVQQQLESYVLVPKLMGHQVGLSALGIIVALLLGGSLMGILGAVLGVPTAAILQVVWQRWTLRD